MATKYEFTQGNRRAFFAIIVKNRLTNAAVDLTGATVTFYFREQGAIDAKVSAGAATLTDAVNGKVEYRWAAGDLDVPGIYDAEFRVAHADALVQSVFVDNVRVRAKLA